MIHSRGPFRRYVPGMVVFVGLTLAHPDVAAPSQARSAPIDDLKAWREAADRHEPGALDSPAFELASWEQERLDRTLATLVDLVRDLQKGPRRAGPRAGDRPADEVDAYSWLGLSPDERARGDMTRIVKRGVLLHTDIAVLVEDRLKPPPGSTPARGRGASVSVLDGQFVGYGLNSDHLDFARRLLDRVRPSPQGDPAVARWYRAVAAHLADQSDYAALGRHVYEGRRLLARDAMLAMMDGVQHQALGSPRLQAAIATIVVPRGSVLAVGSRGEELARARRAYEDALRLDPGLVEARIRLGRVLADEGSAAAAAASLRDATDGAQEPVLQYYAALFLGEQQAALGQASAARASFERASALYPGAQSPLLALSQLARASGDRSGALDALARLMRLRPQGDAGDDPWWLFHASAGRRSSQWLDEARASLLEGESR